MADSTGRFIVLEGLDGAGTTTQAAELHQYLSEKGVSSELTREPTDEPIGDLIRQAVSGRLISATDSKSVHLSEAALCLLFAADRLEHSDRIEHARRLGKTVISDRYVFSSIAYQSRDPSISAQHVVEANRGIAVPDVTLFLHVPVPECLKRLKKRGDERAIYEKKEILEAIASNYEATRPLYERHFGPVVHLDGTQPIASVHASIVKSVADLFA